jgi:malonyl-CoA decarboxylase
MSASPFARRSSRSLADLIDIRARLMRDVNHRASRAAASDGIARCLRAHFAAEPPQLRRIDGGTSRDILDRIVRSEAVHAFRDERDLWRRLQEDRRCYALFSASMPDEPLAFTEVALTRGISAEVNTILDSESPIGDPASCDCAMFYSISSCHEGLRGVPFGNSLIRQVVDRLSAELPSVRTFATVSPVPGFRAWIADLAARGHVRLVEIEAMIDDGRWMHGHDGATELESALLALCASYLRHARRGREPLDPVARFHLGNGARLERLNWLGDRSVAGVTRSAGITANYLYDLARVDANHAAYHASHAVIVAPEIESLARQAASIG